MNRSIIAVAVAAGLLLTASAPAQDLRHGRRPRSWVGYPYSAYPFGYGFGRGYGFGLGFAYRPVTPLRTVYRNAFTADVAYAEEASNDFRAAYEKRKGDPLALKADVQRLDQNLERMRREAESYGNVTIRGTELFRDALSQASVIESRLDTGDAELSARWNRVRSVLENLTRTYRVK
ncbi:MAG: hypothetical protein ACO1SV_02680 [Fimbriimonas sp.]